MSVTHEEVSTLIKMARNSIDIQYGEGYSIKNPAFTAEIIKAILQIQYHKTALKEQAGTRTAVRGSGMGEV